MKQLLLIYLLILILAATSCLKKNRVKSSKPNILLVLVDDMSWNGISCYGEKPWKTPHIDKLATNGMKFTNAYASTVCSPTRASIMTGMNPARLGITNWIPGGVNRYANPRLIEKPFNQFLPLEEITLAEALKQQGYETAMVGKWHLGSNLMHLPDKQGFDYHYMVSPSNTSSYFVEKDSIQLKGFYNHDKDGRQFLTEQLVDKAIDWFSKPKTKPWFMYFSTHAVHTPVAAKGEVIQKYLDAGLSAIEPDAADYAAMHQHMDDAIGRLLSYIEVNGLDKNTIIAFLSDNGGRYPQTVNTPFSGGKGELLEGGIRIPLIFQWNGKIAAGTENNTPVITDDLFPTLLDLAGLQMPKNKDFDGVSIKNILTEDAEGLKDRSLYWHFPHYTGKLYGKPSSAVRKGDWKLIHLFEDNTQELYNLKEDIGEKNNLIDKNPDVAKAIYLELDNWRKELNVKMPEINPDYNSTLPSGWPQDLIDEPK